MPKFKNVKCDILSNFQTMFWSQILLIHGNFSLFQIKKLPKKKDYFSWDSSQSWKFSKAWLGKIKIVSFWCEILVTVPNGWRSWSFLPKRKEARKNMLRSSSTSHIILELALKGNLSQVSSHDLDRRSNENNKLNWRTSGTYTKSHGGILRAKNETSRF